MNDKVQSRDSNIPDHITKEHIRNAVEDYINESVPHRFIESITYDVIIDGNRYPPKAIIGLASRYILGEALTPAHFSAGLHTKCFRTLEENGFPIVLKSEDIIYPDDVPEQDIHIEGAVKKVYVNRYERNTEARDKCIEYYGLKCSVCNFDFEKTYGDIGAGFIHVHHLRSIASIGQEYDIDPIKDLRPVCPNCHAMLHKKKEPFSIEELKSFMI
ncbi:MAG: HNH endonuclease [Sulfurimonadaceae bacterium]